MVDKEFFESQLELYADGGMPELRPLMPMLQQAKGTVAIDIGANIGEISYFLRYHGGVNIVHAFEPNPIIFKKLQELVPNGIIPYQIALSNKHGHSLLFVPRIPDSDEFNTGLSTLHLEWVQFMANEFPDSVNTETLTYEVDLKPLDDFTFNDIKVIKIDVEGSEIEVLEGAKRTINQHHPMIIIEAFANIDDIYDIVMSENYKCLYYNTSTEQLEEFTKDKKLNGSYNLIFV